MIAFQGAFLAVIILFVVFTIWVFTELKAYREYEHGLISIRKVRSITWTFVTILTADFCFYAFCICVGVYSILQALMR